MKEKCKRKASENSENKIIEKVEKGNIRVEEQNGKNRVEKATEKNSK